MSPSKVCWDWMIKDMTYLFRQWLSFEETIARVTKATCRVSLFQRNSSDNCRKWQIWSQHNCILFCCWPRCLLFSLSSQFSVLPKTSSGIKYCLYFFPHPDKAGLTSARPGCTDMWQPIWAQGGEQQQMNPDSFQNANYLSGSEDKFPSWGTSCMAGFQPSVNRRATCLFIYFFN